MCLILLRIMRFISFFQFMCSWCFLFLFGFYSSGVLMCCVVSGMVCLFFIGIYRMCCSLCCIWLFFQVMLLLLVNGVMQMKVVFSGCFWLLMGIVLSLIFSVVKFCLGLLFVLVFSYSFSRMFVQFLLCFRLCGMGIFVSVVSLFSEQLVSWWVWVSSCF